MTYFSVPGWKAIQPYLIVGKIAVLVLGSLIYLQIYELAKPKRIEEPLDYAKRFS